MSNLCNAPQFLVRRRKFVAVCELRLTEAGDRFLPMWQPVRAFGLGVRPVDQGRPTGKKPRLVRVIHG